MTKTKQTWRLAKLPLAVSLASTLAAPAFGVTFNIGAYSPAIKNY